MLIVEGKTYVISSGSRQIQAVVETGSSLKLNISQDGLTPHTLKEFTEDGVYNDDLVHSKISIEVTGTAQLSIMPAAGITEIS